MMTREEAKDYIREWCPYDRQEEIIKALEHEPCEDAVRIGDIRKLPPVTPKSKIGHCKDCKYFEYNSMAKVDGIPLIVAHEICSRWGDGCRTKEDGYCFLFEKQESEDKE